MSQPRRPDPVTLTILGGLVGGATLGCVLIAGWLLFRQPATVPISNEMLRAREDQQALERWQRENPGKRTVAQAGAFGPRTQAEQDAADAADEAAIAAYQKETRERGVTVQRVR